MTGKIGISAFAWTAAFTARHLGLLPQLRERGFAALELPMFCPGALPAAAIRRAFAANDLACTVCAILPAGINPISLDAATRSRLIVHLIECVEATAEMGGHLLGGPLFAPIGLPRAALRMVRMELQRQQPSKQPPEWPLTDSYFLASGTT